MSSEHASIRGNGYVPGSETHPIQITMHPGNERYRERYNAVVKQLERASAKNLAHRSRLDEAMRAYKKVEAERDMLLDSIASRVTSQPTLVRFLEDMGYYSDHEQIPIQNTLPNSGGYKPESYPGSC